MWDKKFLTKYNFLSQTIIFAHPALAQNFVGTASPRSSSFVPFADPGMLSLFELPTHMAGSGETRHHRPTYG